MERRSHAEDEYDNLIRPVMMVSKAISVWPLRKDRPNSTMFFRKCHLFLLLMMLLLTCVTVTADAIHHFDDLDEFTECAMLCCAFYLTVIRIVVYTLHQKDMLTVVEIMKQDWVYSSHEERTVLRKKCFFAFQLTKYFIIMVAVTIISFSCMPILEIYLLGSERKILPFRGYFFANQTVSPIYECLYIFNIIAGSFGGSTIASATSFNLVATTHGAAKFAMLRKKLEALNHDNPNVDRTMAECVKRHQEAITFADALERTISLLAFAQFVISIGLICFAGFQVTAMMEDKERLMKYLAFLNAAIVELFMFSFSGNDLIDESEAVGESAYNGGWIGGTFGRSLQIVMMRSKIPSRITAAKFYNMSLQSFSQVLNTSFSYMMVLKATKNE